MNFLSPAFNSKIELKFPNIKFDDISNFTKIDEIVTDNQTGLDNNFYFQESLARLESPYFLVSIFSNGQSVAFLPISRLPHKTVLSDINVYSRIKSEEDVIDTNSYSNDDINQIVNVAKTDIITFNTTIDLSHLDVVLFDNTRFVVVCKENDIYTACKECQNAISTVDSKLGCKVFLELLDKKTQGSYQPTQITKNYVDSQDNSVLNDSKSYTDSEIKKTTELFDDKLSDYGVKTISVMKDDITNIHSELKKLGTSEQSDSQFINSLQEKMNDLSKEIASISSHTQTKGMATEAELNALQKHLEDQLSASVGVLNSNISNNDAINYYKAELTPNGNGIRLTRKNGQTTDVEITESLAMEKTILTLSKQYTDSVKSDLESLIQQSKEDGTNYFEFINQQDLESRINISKKYNYMFAQQGESSIDVKIPVGSLEGSILIVETAENVTLSINSKDTSLETFEITTDAYVVDENNRVTFLAIQDGSVLNWRVINLEDLNPVEPSGIQNVVVKNNELTYNVKGFIFDAGIKVRGEQNNLAQIEIDPLFNSNNYDETILVTNFNNEQIRGNTHIFFEDTLYSNSQGIITDRSNKRYIINESIDKDPNIEQEHAFIALITSFEGSLTPNYEMTVSLVDNTGTVLIDIEGNEATKKIKNVVGSSVNPIVIDIKGIFAIKANLNFNIKVSFNNEENIAMSLLSYERNTQLMIVNLDKKKIVNPAVLQYQNNNNIDLQFKKESLGEIYDQRYFFSGKTEVNNLIAPAYTMGDENLGIYLYSGDGPVSLSYTNDNLILKPTTDSALFFPSYGYLLNDPDEVKTLWGQEIYIVGEAKARYTSLSLGIYEYTLKNDWDITKPIIKGYGNPDNQGDRVLIALGWNKVADSFIPESVDGTFKKFDLKKVISNKATGLAVLFNVPMPFSTGDASTDTIVVGDLMIQRSVQKNMWQFFETIE